MINCIAYDVEVLPNFFSVTFVDLDDYLREFKDVCEVSVKKGKEVRSQIADLANEAAERAQDYCEQVKDKWAEVTAEKAEPAKKEA